MSFDPEPMDPSNKKLLLYQYCVVSFVEWFETEFQSENNDISVLKSMKLLYFLTASSAFVHDNIIHRDYFSNFFAMPYGPVESHIYDLLKVSKGKLSHLTINSTKTTLRYSIQESYERISDDLNDQLAINAIHRALDFLKESNNSFIKMKSFELVDYSHMWYSWRKNMAIANANGMNSQPIPPEDIENDSVNLQLAY